MASEARKNQKKHRSHSLSIERFAYDMFSYILPKFGFPERCILRTDIKGNIYINKDFVEKAALSVLPLAMYMRDSWKQIFEYRQNRTGFKDLKMIHGYLKGVLKRNSDFQNADVATKVRVSLALFIEIMLFFKYKGLVTHVENLPKLWSKFYLDHITKNQDIEKLFESSFLMFPEVSESSEWILTFVEKYAVPYGRVTNLSEIFSVYSILSEDSKISPLKKNSKYNATQDHCDIPDEFVAETHNVVDQNSGSSFPRESQPVHQTDLKIQDHLVNTSSEENTYLERNASRKQPTPSTDVSEMNSMGQQRKPSEQTIEDAFGQMSLDRAKVFSRMSMSETKA